MEINLKEIDAFIEENRDNILRDISRLVEIPSIEGVPEEGAPFGKEPKRALEKALEIAGELGLETRNCENYIGYAELKGEDEEKYLATISHLDVVPVGDGWARDPFTMWGRDDYIIGRGVMDDKGPSVVALYTLKYLKEKKIPLKYSVRALLGTNEETGMKDVKYYLENYPAPVFCYSPDGDFPVCNGEMGIINGEIISKCALDKIVSISAGNAYNIIPDKAEAVLKFNGENIKFQNDVDICLKDGFLCLTAKGVAGHASMPEGKKNAIGVLVNYILDNNLVSEEEAKYFNVLKKFHSDPYGKGVGADANDGKFPPLTIVGGMIRIKDGKIYQSVDSRYPTNSNGKIICEALKNAAEGNADIELVSEMEPFYIDPETPEIQTCINTYNEITGDNLELFTMGGGTYARDFPNAVSFGPEHPERPSPKYIGAVHCVDEGANVEWLLEALKVYIATMIRLQEVKF